MMDPDPPPASRRREGDTSSLHSDEFRSSLAPLVSRPGRAALFFDIDGVLAPIRPRPEQAAIPEQTRALLEKLTRSYLLVAVVSGRSLDSAATMVDVPALVIVGDHGREMRDEDGSVRQIAGVDLLPLRQAAAALEGDPGLRRAGVRVEDKPGSVALHTRGLVDREGGAAAARAAAEREARIHGLHVREGRAIVELRPPGVDKGTAVRLLLDRSCARSVLYVGDDATDVDAMRALDGRRSPDLSVLLIGVWSEEMPEELPYVADHLLHQPDVPLLLEMLSKSDPAAR
jgi:trehalose 6-phosphate phosphatase